MREKEKIAEIIAKDIETAKRLQKILEDSGFLTFHFLDIGDIEKVYVFKERQYNI